MPGSCEPPNVSSENGAQDLYKAVHTLHPQAPLPAPDESFLEWFKKWSFLDIPKMN